MPVEGRLVGEGVDGVVVDVHAVCQVLDDDAALGVGDDPVKRAGFHPADLDAHHGGIAQGGLCLVDGGEHAADP